MLSDYIDAITRESHLVFDFEVLPPVREFYSDAKQAVDFGNLAVPTADDLRKRIERDIWPLPSAKDREGYFGSNHYGYWLSGLSEYLKIRDACAALDVPGGPLLDIGSCSGRVARHFLAQENPAPVVYAADINLRYIDWMLSNIPNIIAFQNSTLPNLPIPDNALSAIYAFSVFTHIDVFDIAWILEFKRTLKPGGIAYLSVTTDNSLAKAKPDWPIYRNLSSRSDVPNNVFMEPMVKDRYIFKWREGAASAATVVLHRDYIKKAWGRILPIRQFLPNYHNIFQDVVILQKE